MNIYGSIQAIGTKYEPIIFTSNSSNPDFLDWGGIQIKDDYPGNATFKYCLFDYCYEIESQKSGTFENCTFFKARGIFIYSDSNNEPVTIKDCSFTGTIEGASSYNAGIYVSGVKDAIIVNNKITTNNGKATIIGINGKLVFADNYIAAFGGIHMYVSGPEKGLVENNIVENGTFSIAGNVNVTNNYALMGFGLYFEDFRADIYHNSVYGGLFIFDLEKQTTTLDIRYNYWGHDWDVEDTLPLYGSAFYPDYYSFQYPDILYQPYYDSNWTLTDTDGIPNGWEHKHGLNIYENDSSEDPDSDGLTNLQEWQQGGNFTAGGTNPQNSDTDEDQLPDGWEVKYKFDPISKNESKSDPDVDGYTNLEEYKAGTDPTDPLSHPTEPDHGDHTTLIIIAIIAGLLLLIIIIVIVALMMKRKKAKETKKTGVKGDVVEAQVVKDSAKHVEIECPNCSKRFKHKAGATAIKCPHCAFEGNLE